MAGSKAAATQYGGIATFTTDRDRLSAVLSTAGLCTPGLSHHETADLILAVLDAVAAAAVFRPGQPVQYRLSTEGRWRDGTFARYDPVPAGQEARVKVVPAHLPGDHNQVTVQLAHVRRAARGDRA